MIALNASAILKFIETNNVALGTTTERHEQPDGSFVVHTYTTAKEVNRVHYENDKLRIVTLCVHTHDTGAIDCGEQEEFVVEPNERVCAVLSEAGVRNGKSWSFPAELVDLLQPASRFDKLRALIE